MSKKRFRPVISSSSEDDEEQETNLFEHIGDLLQNETIESELSEGPIWNKPLTKAEQQEKLRFAKKAQEQRKIQHEKEKQEKIQRRKKRVLQLKQKQEQEQAEHKARKAEKQEKIKQRRKEKRLQKKQAKINAKKQELSKTELNELKRLTQLVMVWGYSYDPRIEPHLNYEKIAHQIEYASCYDLTRLTDMPMRALSKIRHNGKDPGFETIRNDTLQRWGSEVVIDPCPDMKEYYKQYLQRTQPIWKIFDIIYKNAKKNNESHSVGFLSVLEGLYTTKMLLQGKPKETISRRIATFIKNNYST